MKPIKSKGFYSFVWGSLFAFFVLWGWGFPIRTMEVMRPLAWREFDVSNHTFAGYSSLLAHHYRCRYFMPAIVIVKASGFDELFYLYKLLTI